MSGNQMAFFRVGSVDCHFIAANENDSIRGKPKSRCTPSNKFSLHIGPHLTCIFKCFTFWYFARDGQEVTTTFCRLSVSRIGQFAAIVEMSHRLIDLRSEVLELDRVRLVIRAPKKYFQFPTSPIWLRFSPTEPLHRSQFRARW